MTNTKQRCVELVREIHQKLRDADAEAKADVAARAALLQQRVEDETLLCLSKLTHQVPYRGTLGDLVQSVEVQVPSALLTPVATALKELGLYAGVDVKRSTVRVVATVPQETST